MLNVLLQNFFQINVGAYVFPRSPVLHIGNRLSFSILGKGELILTLSSYWFLLVYLDSFLTNDVRVNLFGK
jgi:hypothetical protein